MRLRPWNAGLAFLFLVVSVFTIVAAIRPAVAQSYEDRFQAEYVLLGPRIESGLAVFLDQARDERYCRLTKEEVRQKLRKSSSGVVAAAYEVLREARVRCEARKYGFIQGFNASVGVGGSFGLNSTTETTRIGSAGVLDPINAATRNTGIDSSGVVGRIGIGYDWNINNLLSPSRLAGGGGGYFAGVNVDVTFGGGSKSIAGIPGVVPFIPPGVARMDTLRFRNDMTVDLTARLGTYVSPTIAIYGLAGLSLSSISLKYDCATTGFCGVAPATAPFSAETSRWSTGGVIGAGIETRVDALSRILPIGNSAPSLYLEYRAYFVEPMTLDVGSVATRSTSQELDLTYQTVLGGARFRF